MKLIATAALGAALLWAQSARRAFDVALIKPNQDGHGGSLIRTPGQLVVTNADFEYLIQMAYQTRQLDLSRVPDSLRSERFDIIGKASGKITGDEYWDMLQVLLEDLFKLAYHRETRETQIFALVVDRKVSAKRGGPRAETEQVGECGLPGEPGRAQLLRREPRSRIARELSPFAGRPVLDETGLTGAFDFMLTWAAEPGLWKGDPAFAPNGPSCSAAIQEQLGLKLESKKSPIEILVIDRAEPPTEN